MSTPLTPSKRPLDGNLAETNGKGKLQKSAENLTQNPPPKFSSDGVVFRVVCSASRVDSVTGENSSFLSQISQESGAQVRVEEAVAGCTERVIAICNPDIGIEAGTQKTKEDNVEEAKGIEAVEDRKDQDGNDDDKNSDQVGNSKSEKTASNAQKALLLVFERLVKSEPDTDVVNDEHNKCSPSVLKLLVLSSQVGCILGKGGSVIKQMAAESGAQIRILPRDKLPLCASASDEVVQIMGEVDAVRRALQSASGQLLKNPRRDHEMFSSNPTEPPSHSSNHSIPAQEEYGLSNNSSRSHGTPSVADTRSVPSLKSKFRDGGLPGRIMPSREKLTFRILCPDEKVGGVIGKGGAIVKTLKLDTGCEIKIMDRVSDSEARVIVISGPAHPDDRISPPQDAILRVQTRIVRATPDSKDKNVTARLLVSSNQIGCLLGKAGSVISEMRKVSGAYIRIMGKEQIPKCASEGEEVVQINGEYEAVQEALIQITSRLRLHFFRDAFPSLHLPSHPTFLDQASPFPPYMGRREFSPPGRYSNLGSSFHNFDSVGGPLPHGAFHPNDDHPRFLHNIHRSGMPPHITERRPWGPEGFMEGDGPMGFPDFPGGPNRRKSGFGGNQPAIITSTTVEVVVPNSLVPVIRGEDGACLKQIRQISDAKVTITDSKPGSSETLIIISGTPEQTHAAQSLIQAFVMTETEST